MSATPEREIVWECPCCDWIVSDVLYLAIKCDPDCPGCGAKKYSEFRQVERRQP